MTYPKTKQEITQVVLKQLPKNSVWFTLPEDKILFRWWASGRSGSSLRLTNEGALAFESANIAYYDFPVVFDATKPNSCLLNGGRGFLLMLSKKMKCPYWISTKRDTSQANINRGVGVEVRVYDHQIAMMISIFNDIHEYLDSIK